MAFPDTIVTFPTMQDITASDGVLVAQYQQAMENQDTALALEILSRISNYTRKIITASYLNSIGTTVKALELYYLDKYSPAVVVSTTQPLQSKKDMWFEITGVNT